MGRGVRAAHRRLRAAGASLKILDLTEFFSPTGGGVRTYLTAKATFFSSQHDHEHVIVAPGPRTERTDFHGSRLHLVSGPRAPRSPGYHVLWNWRGVRAVIERERPNVIELGSVYLAPWCLRRILRQRPIPVVGFFHFDFATVAVRTAGRVLPQALRGRVHDLLSRYVRAAYRQCHCVVGPSEAARQAMTDTGLTRVRVVPLGVDLETFQPTRRDDTWKTEVGAVRDQPVALYVGRLGDEKNLDVVLGALPELHCAHGLRLVTIGEGPLRPRFEAFARDHPAALVLLPFEEQRERLARAYASADVLLSPCPDESFGMAALEAAACGLPVVSAAGGAVGVRVAPEPWARTFRATDPGDLVRAVTELLGAVTPGLRERARVASATFGWARTFEALLDVYREVTVAA